MTSCRTVHRLAVALLLTITVTACQSHGTGSATTSPTTSGATTVDARDITLTRLAADLRATVNDLTGPLSAHTTHRYLTGDEPSTCHLGDDADGPQHWTYSVSLDLSLDDSGPTIRNAAATLQAQGWSVRENPTNPGEVDLTAQKNGASIGMAGGSRPSSNVVFQGFTACVYPDGTIDTSPLP